MAAWLTSLASAGKPLTSSPSMAAWLTSLASAGKPLASDLFTFNGSLADLTGFSRKKTSQESPRISACITITTRVHGRKKTATSAYRVSLSPPPHTQPPPPPSMHRLSRRKEFSAIAVATGGRNGDVWNP
ncbi:hypothetical protein ACOMHN_034931 [Nucella lapillus]